MPSLVAWLDSTPEEQKAARELVAMFSDKESRDELGIGPIRDAFSDLLFPGTSVLQTRARYYLFVPWCYLTPDVLRLSGRQHRDKGRGNEQALPRLPPSTLTSIRTDHLGCRRRARLHCSTSSDQTTHLEPLPIPGPMRTPHRAPRSRTFDSISGPTHPGLEREQDSSSGTAAKLVMAQSNGSCDALAASPKNAAPRLDAYRVGCSAASPRSTSSAPVAAKSLGLKV